MSSQKKMKVSDYISIGIYTAIYFLVVAVSALICVFIIPGYSYDFIPVIAGLLSGPIFMLMAAKVQKFGAISIMGGIMAIYFLIFGRSVVAFIFNLVCVLLADGIAYFFNYKSRSGLMLAYIPFAFSNFGPVFPLFFQTQSYIERLISDQRDAAYIQGVIDVATSQTAVLIIILTLVAALIGGWLGQKMMKKHFERAGIV